MGLNSERHTVMAKKDIQESTAGILKQFDALKEKHPDALLLFRTGDFY